MCVFYILWMMPQKHTVEWKESKVYFANNNNNNKRLKLSINCIADGKWRAFCRKFKLLIRFIIHCLNCHAFCKSHIIFVHLWPQFIISLSMVLKVEDIGKNSIALTMKIFHNVENWLEIEDWEKKKLQTSIVHRLWDDVIEKMLISSSSLLPE